MSLSATVEVRKPKETKFQEDVNAFSHHPDLAEPDMESSGKTELWFAVLAQYHKGKCTAEREQLKNWDCVLDWNRRGGQEWVKKSERDPANISPPCPFFIADASRLRALMTNPQDVRLSAWDQKPCVGSCIARWPHS